MKRRLFIGSSTEGLNVAKKVKSYLEDVFDCHLWNEDVFNLNKGTLDNLIRAANLYDFAIMVWTADDIANVRDSVCGIPRDNVLFEHGLFLGSIGLGKSYVLCEKGIKVPTDLLGCTLSYFETDTIGKEKLPKENIVESLDTLKNDMLEHVANGYLSMLPSTSLAIAYYDNFVHRVCNWIICQDKQFKIKETIYNDVRLNIVKPKLIEDDMNSLMSVYCKKQKLDDFILTSVGGGRPINVKAHTISSEGGNRLDIYDIPTTLIGIRKSVNLCFPQYHVGKEKDKEYVEQREVENFFKVLQYLCNANACSRDCVVIS